MANTVITIARGYGSGGRTIGRLIAEKMNISFYDRNLIYLASDKSGVDLELFLKNDEAPAKQSFFERLSNLSLKNVPPESGRFKSHMDIFKYQSEIIRELAKKGDCVIIGRCANHTLKDSGCKLVRVFIWAPHSKCVETVMNKFSVTETEADKTIRDIDKHRSEYYKYYTGNNWEDIRNYDLCVNTAEHDDESAANLICRVASVF